MKETKHTPGPWRHVPELSLDGTQLVYGPAADGGHRLVADAGRILRRTEEEMIANARLIAAAPRMFAYIAEKAAEGCPEAKDIITEVTQ